MTAEEKVKRLLLNGLSKDQVSEALRLFKDSKDGELMKGRWLEDAADYPPTLYPVLMLSVKQYCPQPKTTKGEH